MILLNPLYICCSGKKNDATGGYSMSFFLSGWMLYTMLAVLTVIGLNLIVGVYKAVTANRFTFAVLPQFLLAILHYILPMLILVNLIPLDPTKVVVLIAYYVGGVGVILKYLLDIQSKISK
jgi:hypothetical protein